MVLGTSTPGVLLRNKRLNCAHACARNSVNLSQEPGFLREKMTQMKEEHEKARTFQGLRDGGLTG